MPDHRGLVTDGVHIGQQAAQQLGVPDVAVHQLVVSHPFRRRTAAVGLRQERIEQQHRVPFGGEQVGDV